MMTISRWVLAGAMAVILVPAFGPSAQAACDITIRFTNNGEQSLTLLPEWARTRTRLGTWRMMWRDADPVVIAPGQRYERDFRARQCAWTVMRRFEFHIEREPCRYQGATTTAQVYRGGGGRNRRNEPDAGDVLTVTEPGSGFLRMDSLDPNDPDNAGLSGFEGDGLQLLVQDLGRVCDAARNPS